VNTNLLRDPLDGLSPALRIAALSEVARADGLSSADRDLLEQQAARLGVDLDNLPAAPHDLSTLPQPTRILIYRDAATLALLDGLSDSETRDLNGLAECMGLSAETCAATAWSRDYASLMERLDALLDG